MHGTDGEKPYCDLVMKGGITSGVVYPQAVCELAQRYRLKCIGGASAGAIAAAAAAAAEKGRARGGFDELAKVSDEVALKLESLFQPSDALRPLFDALLACIDATKTQGERVTAALGTLLLGYAPSVVLGALPALVLALLGWRFEAGWGLWLSVLLLLAVGVLVALVLRLVVAITREIPANFFGFCSGKTQPGRTEGLGEWLTDLFDRLAHGAPADPESRPLTFGDLRGDGKEPEIDLQIMTTCLAQARPYRMPFRENLFLWREADFRRLFGDRVVEHMLKTSSPHEKASGFRHLPRTRDFPVVVAVRMSLSFPILLSAVPLYAFDYTQKSESARAIPRRMWFSDGGICSNFPIHFFDSVWPTRPTFGINLDRFSTEHHDERVFLPRRARDGILRTPRSVGGLFEFLGSIVDSMQEWRDVLQTSLPGYRERIATVRLSSNEGGINLRMPPPLVKQLGVYGAEAGALLRDQFSFERHRWRRHLVWMAEFEQLLERGQKVWGEAPLGGETLREFVLRYSSLADEYEQSEAWQQASLDDLSEWMKLAESWLARPQLRDGRIPKPDVDVRLTPLV